MVTVEAVVVEPTVVAQPAVVINGEPLSPGNPQAWKVDTWSGSARTSMLKGKLNAPWTSSAAAGRRRRRRRPRHFDQAFILNKEVIRHVRQRRRRRRRGVASITN